VCVCVCVWFQTRSRPRQTWKGKLQESQVNFFFGEPTRISLKIAVNEVESSSDVSVISVSVISASYLIINYVAGVSIRNQFQLPSLQRGRTKRPSRSIVTDEQVPTPIKSRISIQFKRYCPTANDLPVKWVEMIDQYELHDYLVF